MNRTIDYIIDSETDLALFGFFLKEHLNIQTNLTLQSITFYNSWWTSDILQPGVSPFLLSVNRFTQIKRVPLDKYHWCVNTFRQGICNEEDVCIPEPYKNLDEFCSDDENHPDSTIREYNIAVSSYTFPFLKHFSLSELCSYWGDFLKTLNIDHVKMYCYNSNYIVIELTEDKEFSLKATFEIMEEKLKLETNIRGLQLSAVTKKTYTHTAEVLNKWFGFKHEKFSRKVKYYSTSPLNFYRTDLFLRSNLVEQQNTFYNNEYSDILCEFPVDDRDQIKHQRYEPPNCTKGVNQITNYLKFEITDEHGKVVNFRGMPVKLVFSLEINEEKQACDRVCDTC